MTRERVMQLRALLMKAAKNLKDDDAFYCPEFFEPWKPNTGYKRGDRLRYGEKLYRVEQDHTSQSDWTPDITPALYTEIPDPAIEYPEWKQPISAETAYRIGAKVSHNNKHWVNEYDYNTYEPGVYGWREVTEGE